MAKSLTSANALITLAVPGVFNTPQQLQGFATDDIFSTEPLKSAEVLMGVDGRLSGGFVFVAVEQMYTLQADSDSNDIFDEWWTAQQVIQDVLPASGAVTLFSTQTVYTMIRGFLTTYPITPDAGKLLRPRKFGITWESAFPAPVL